jgi:hypothetical protein
MVTWHVRQGRAAGLPQSVLPGGNGANLPVPVLILVQGLSQGLWFKMAIFHE